MEKDEKMQTLESILLSLNEWDGTSSAAIEIIASNGPYFTKLKNMEIDEKNTALPIQQQIVDKQRELMNLIHSEREKLTSQLNQVSKKSTVVNNYMSVKKPSVFVDRNF